MTTRDVSQTDTEKAVVPQAVKNYLIDANQLAKIKQVASRLHTENRMNGDEMPRSGPRPHRYPRHLHPTGDPGDHMKTTTKPYTPSALRREIQSRAFTRRAGYHVDVSWRYLEEWITSQAEINLNLDPDFQRAHVWTRQQQTAYVEYVLRGGEAAKELYFNCVGWNASKTGDFVIVDGKQRLEAARAFLRGDVPVFSKTLPEWGGAADDVLRLHFGFKVYINDLGTREEVLKWYLDINTGGTPHTEVEILKVEIMLRGAEPKENQDVHTEHCCKLHGCKYGDDDCPVATGKKRQSHTCQSCWDAERDSEDRHQP
jgi:hypothetical protein